MMLVFLLATLQGDPLTADPETLNAYLVHACGVQQAANQGGETADYDAFCFCLADDLQDGMEADMFRVMALGGQGQLGEHAMAPDWEAARDETAAVFGTWEPERQLEMGARLQESLAACILLSPARPDGMPPAQDE